MIDQATDGAPTDRPTRGGRTRRGRTPTVRHDVEDPAGGSRTIDVKVERQIEVERQVVPPDQIATVISRPAQPAAVPVQPAQQDPIASVIFDIEAGVGRAWNRSTCLSNATCCRLYLDWLGSKGWNLTSAPAAALSEWLSTTYANLITHNKSRQALVHFYEALRSRGVPAAEQVVPPPMKRTRNTQMSSTPAQNVQPIVAQPSGVAPSASQPSTVPAAAVPPGGIPFNTSAPARATPSMGQMLMLSKMPTPDDISRGYPVGQPIIIGNFHRIQLDQAGTDEQFLINHIRPSFGPGTYTWVDLDTSGKPRPGGWHRILGPEVTLNGTHANGISGGMSGPGPSPTIAGGSTLSPVGALVGTSGNIANAGMDLFRTVMDRTINLAEQERQVYEKRRQQLEERRQSSELNDTQFMLLMQQTERQHEQSQRQFNELIETMRREAQEARQVATSMSPAMLATSPAAATPDASHTLLADVVKQMNEMMQRMFSRLETPPQQQDPLAGLERWATLQKALAPPPPPPNPIQDTLVAMTLENLRTPKTSAFADLIQAKKAFDALTGGSNTNAPTLIEQVGGLVEAIGANADGLSTLFEGITRGRVSSMLAKGKKQRTIAAQQQAKPTSGERAVPVPENLQKTFLALIQTNLTAEPAEKVDEQLIMGLMSLVTELNKSPPQWAQLARGFHQHINNVNTRAEIRGLITQLYKLLGAEKLIEHANFGTPVIDRLTSVLYENYPGIYGMLNNGAERDLAERSAMQSAVKETPNVEASSDDADDADDADDVDDDEDTTAGEVADVKQNVG